jgi:hypothetical protein
LKNNLNQAYPGMFIKNSGGIDEESVEMDMIMFLFVCISEKKSAVLRSPLFQSGNYYQYKALCGLWSDLAEICDGGLSFLMVCQNRETCKIVEIEAGKQNSIVVERVDMHLVRDENKMRKCVDAVVITVQEFVEIHQLCGMEEVLRRLKSVVFFEFGNVFRRLTTDLKQIISQFVKQDEKFILFIDSGESDAGIQNPLNVYPECPSLLTHPI